MIPDDQKQALDQQARVAQLNYFIAKTHSDAYAKQVELDQIAKNREAYEEELRQLQEAMQLPDTTNEAI